MTTIILTIIGIILAAASAMMVVFYGGSTFSTASVGADANVLQNTGISVINAVNLVRFDYGNSVSISAANDVARFELLTRSSGQSGQYMNGFPQLPAGMTQSLTIGNQYQVIGVRPDVCLRLNDNLKIPDPTSINDTVKMACYLPSGATTGTFFANP